jgi:hypothetical protein
VVKEAPAVVDLASQLTPLSIRHGTLDLAWSVLAVLDDWTTPRYSEVAGTPLESKRFRVRVHGPLPGLPSKEGEFVMIVRRYGDRDGWWIAPEMTLTARAGTLGLSSVRADGESQRRRAPRSRPRWPVQQQSTATEAEANGLQRTLTERTPLLAESFQT